VVLYVNRTLRNSCIPLNISFHQETASILKKRNVEKFPRSLWTIRIQTELSYFPSLNYILRLTFHLHQDLRSGTFLSVLSEQIYALQHSSFWFYKSKNVWGRINIMCFSLHTFILSHTSFFFQEVILYYFVLKPCRH
jgi:hypothetical protein